MTQVTIKLLPHQLNALSSTAKIAGLCGSRTCAWEDVLYEC